MKQSFSWLKNQLIWLKPQTKFIFTFIALVIIFTLCLFWLVNSTAQGATIYGSQIDNGEYVSGATTIYLSPNIPNVSAPSSTYFIRFIDPINGQFIGQYLDFFTSYQNYLNNTPLCSSPTDCVFNVNTSTILVHKYVGALTSGTNMYAGNSQQFHTFSGTASAYYQTGTSGINSHPTYIITDDPSYAFSYTNPYEFLKYNPNFNVSPDFAGATPVALNGLTVGDFPDWIIGGSDGGYGDIIKVYYGQTSAQLTYMDQGVAGYYHEKVIAKSRNLIDTGQSNKTWYARAIQYHNGVEVYNTGIISFTVSGLGGSPTFIPIDPDTGTYNTSTINTTSSIFGSYFQLEVEDCSAYSGGLFSSSTLGALQCFGNNFIKTGVSLIFLPHDLSVNFLKDSFGALTEQFPFNIVFNLASTTQNLVAQGSSSISSFYETHITLNGQDITLVSSSTLDQLGTSNKNLFFGIVSNGAYLLAGLVILLSILGHNRRK